MTTALYGGSFDPIHQGHVSLARALLREGLAGEVWLLVSPRNPFKAGRRMLEDEARLSLARLATRGERGVEVCDEEFRLPRPSYMVATLEALRQLHPEREFVLAVGADNWERFPQWRDAEEILRRHRVIVLPRPGHPVGPTPPGVTVAATPLLDISSTAIRERMRRPGYGGEGLPAAVWAEIKEKGYYKDED